jgi:protein transport protein SEC24
MCNLSNEVPQLFDWNNQTNQPADRWARAELNCGVVEFVAPQEYMVRGVKGGDVVEKGWFG